MAELRVAQDIAVPAERAWEAIADWESQGTWMVATKVRGTASAVGGRLEGWTGIGPLGFLDTMTITEWEPPCRCVVEHTGHVVRGTGGFEVARLGTGGCRVTWWERVELPLGVLGKIGWLAIGPTTRLFFKVSLGRLKRVLETG
ncbi:SRPBCC family protein [Catenulispora sp. NL8]|uniref:SRPBCC family protein n=1 Tax=Catenulispora pinistramenti TaxID=2705254 RepID=A0ABS5KS48_9ACTN|nr:SRPBCC family protein [Catenulispora pinistramenti]MBS2548850.1 SRPBCC family protein [Catenulispora pinistramenti]